MIRKFPDLDAQISQLLADGHSYIEAVIRFAELNNLEIETVATIVKNNRTLKSKVKENAIALNMLKDTPVNGTKAKGKLGKRTKKRKLPAGKRKTRQKA